MTPAMKVLILASIASTEQNIPNLPEAEREAAQEKVNKARASVMDFAATEPEPETAQVIITDGSVSIRGGYIKNLTMTMRG